MRLVSTTLCVAALSVAAATVATAADIPVRRAPAAMVAAPAFSWTGFYIGANVGYGWASGSGTTTVTGNGSGLNGTYSGSGSGVNGVIGGGQLGYNYQTGNIVWGIEGDFQGAGQKKDTTVSCGAGCSVTNTDKVTSFATIRGRVGVTVVPQAMLYVTGGWAYINAKSTVTATNTGSTATLFDTTAGKSGWTVGAGGEWMLWDKWSAKLEYLYMRADNVSSTAAVPASLGGGTATTSTNVSNNVFRGGVNYRF